LTSIAYCLSNYCLIKKMKIIKYKTENKASIIAEALVVLMSGGTVVYPTETAYALGADFYSPGACLKVYMIKARRRDKPLPVIVPDINYAVTLVKFSPQALRIATQYWPGPLTMVQPFIYSKEWSHHGDNYLALRVSSNTIAAGLAHAFGKPLISTSANVSSSDACYSVEDLEQQLKKANKQVDLVIDAGRLEKIKPSTVIKDEAGKFKVLRQGQIVVEQ